jgi:hypothetical protein
LKLVSAKEGKNIDDLFNTVGELALKRKGVIGSTNAGTKVTASTAKESKKKKSCC